MLRQGRGHGRTDIQLHRPVHTCFTALSVPNVEQRVVGQVERKLVQPERRRGASATAAQRHDCSHSRAVGSLLVNIRRSEPSAEGPVVCQPRHAAQLCEGPSRSSVVAQGLMPRREHSLANELHAEHLRRSPAQLQQGNAAIDEGRKQHAVLYRETTNFNTQPRPAQWPSVPSEVRACLATVAQPARGNRSAAKTHRVRPHMMTHPHRTPTWLPAQQVGRREVIFSSAGGSLPADGGPTRGSGADGAAGASCGHQRPRRYEVLERARFEGISCQPARPGRLLLWPLHWLVRRLQPDLWRTR